MVSVISELNDRSREIFRHIVDAYVETGEPIGSRTLSRRLGTNLSPATIRNVMADLEEFGLLYAPHTSAGRVPTEAGLRLFVDGLLEVGAITPDERRALDAQCAVRGRSLEQVLEEASSALSGLSGCAGLVMAPKREGALQHIEFIPLGPGRALVVMVSTDGQVENRILDLPPGLPPSALTMASNYLNARLTGGHTLSETRAVVTAEMAAQRADLDSLTSRLVEQGLAVWADSTADRSDGYLIVRGQAHLLEDVTALGDLERIRGLFQALEAREGALRLLEAAHLAEGVQIYIGAENPLFAQAGCSVVLAPYTNARDQIIGAIGVIGPTRLNYARIIPMVDYTAKLIGRILR
ncbi:heat-inducible transcription repressor HrcA [Elstera cyanobacteriorum]|uniref:Heat-inducible transcription repressor HrcA n=1 Tax=Elstera cyanobacteriorum TaxID=2022747 RepID=A0A255XM19_9PROT|nr:heat-inducible transcriptional repressor HrcA [Elstera cyanobacteriorum]OYQ18007.1 heat-inducible transcriptional repressor HrcA [Elstera cyanobacteriorum]GFZ84510.1 heat-inducible transcription repressor HrcA [Elstera cyanobacteriorum]